jgi:peptide/nickel transport system substrate-binding protein
MDKRRNAHSLSRRKFVTLLAAGAGSTLPLAALGGPGRLLLPDAAAAAAGAPPRPGGELTIGMYRTLDKLDPAVYWGPPETMVTQMVFDSLVYLGNDLNIYPGLATSWTASKDGTQLTFKLRQGVKFHDGTDFNAEAVKFHFDRCVDPATKSQYARSLLGPYDSTVVVDDHTVQLRLKEPFAPIFDSLSQGYLGIPSPAAVKKYGQDFQNHLVGTGPFTFVEWQRDTHITLARNPNYKWGTTFPGKTNAGPPYLDRLTFKFVPEQGTRDALMNGRKELRVEAWPGPLRLRDWRRDSAFSMYEGVSPGTTWFNFINTQKPPTNELAVRQAINYAVSKDTIVKVFYPGFARPTWNLIGPTSFGYDPALDHLYAFNPGKARQLLEEAGWKRGPNGVRVKDGTPLHLDVFTSGFMTENYKQLMLTMLQDVGFSTKLIAGTPADRTVAGSKGLYHLVNREFEASDPHYLVDLFASKNVGSFAWSMNKDPELDQVLAEQDMTVDRKARQALVSRATRRILEQGYVVPIYVTLFVWVTDANVKNFHMDARSWYPYFQDAWIQS